MAELTFIYSTMKSGKSLDLLKNAYQYTESGKKVLLCTSHNGYGPDTAFGTISTRVGLQQSALLMERINVFELAKAERPAAIFTDESQFYSEQHILALATIADRLNIPVFCYGLKNDFRNELFPGSRALLLYADTIQEIRTICSHCENKATMNMRIDSNNNPVFDGKQVQVGDNYIPVCRNCYIQFKSKKVA